MRKKYSTVEEFIGDFPPDTQQLLQKIRKTVKQLVPESTEKISYNIPSFQLNGTYLIYFAGFKKHVSIYPILFGSETFKKKVAPYVKGKGTVQFPLDKPIPYDLIVEIVRVNLEASILRAKKK